MDDGKVLGEGDEGLLLLSQSSSRLSMRVKEYEHNSLEAMLPRPPSSEPAKDNR